jgi:hypothetical protein
VPAEEAAKAMRVSLTVLKRIARKNGITRWPYRKVKSLSRAIAQPAAGGGKAGSQMNVLAGGSAAYRATLAAAQPVHSHAVAGLP